MSFGTELGSLGVLCFGRELGSSEFRDGAGDLGGFCYETEVGSSEFRDRAGELGGFLFRDRVGEQMGAVSFGTKTGSLGFMFEAPVRGSYIR